MYAQSERADTLYFISTPMYYLSLPTVNCFEKTYRDGPQI
jgi:hypothetical protein